MEHKTRGGMSANKKRAFQTTCVSRSPRLPRVCLLLPEKREKLGLFSRQVCTELRMIVTLVDLKGIINIK